MAYLHSNKCISAVGLSSLCNFEKICEFYKIRELSKNYSKRGTSEIHEFFKIKYIN